MILVSKSSEIKKLVNEFGFFEIEYKPTGSAICEVSNVPFSYQLRIVYLPKNLILEFESFEKWLAGLSDDSYTIESFGKFIYDVLLKELHPAGLMVEIRATTEVHAPVIATFGGL